MGDFDDLLAANREYAEDFDMAGFDGIAHAGIAIVTCMDSRLAPLAMVGLKPGDAKIFRNPGGRVTEQALEALVLGVHLLNVEADPRDPAHPVRDGGELRARAARAGRRASAGEDVAWQMVSVVTDQLAALEHDVQAVRTHPLIPKTVAVGGFMYDVDTGLLDQKF